MRCKYSSYKTQYGGKNMSVAIVTGASSGIGAELARGLVARGVDEFWLVARRRARLEALGEELGVKYKCICADLTSKDGVEEIRRALDEEKPSVKYLINAAGFGDFGAFDELPESSIERMIDLNVKALVLITHMTVPYMPKCSHILEVGSASVFTPLPGFNIYASTKAFVYHYAQALAYELRPCGIAVTVFCPGWVKTEFFSRAESEKNSGPKNKKPLLSVEYAVGCAMRAMKKRKILCTCNWYTKMQHLFSKILPNRLLISMWIGMLDKKYKKAK